MTFKNYLLICLSFLLIYFCFQVSKERGEELAIEYGIKFMETSAKASINVEEAFFTLARDIKCKMEKRLVIIYFFFLFFTLLCKMDCSGHRISIFFVLILLIESKKNLFEAFFTLA